MEHLLPPELEKALSGELSHLILKPNSLDVSVCLHSFLERRGITIRQERVFRDDEQKTWLLLSFDKHSAGVLAMELAEEGFLGVIVAGIDAKSP
jgi:tRNA A22 N-methylase